MIQIIRAGQRTAVLIFFLLSILTWASPALADQFTGRVVKVTDGDTIQVMHNGVAEKVRLADIDAPERGQAYGGKARDFAAQLVLGKDVQVNIRTVDRYGRTVGEVLLQDGRSLNRELLAAGFSWVYRKYSTDHDLLALEAEARSAGRGLWRDVDPVPPWEFRKNR